jgi:hypothetical protein
MSLSKFERQTFIALVAEHHVPGDERHGLEIIRIRVRAVYVDSRREKRSDEVLFPSFPSSGRFESNKKIRLFQSTGSKELNHLPLLYSSGKSNNT